MCVLIVQDILLLRRGERRCSYRGSDGLTNMCWLPAKHLPAPPAITISATAHLYVGRPIFSPTSWRGVTGSALCTVKFLDSIGCFTQPHTMCKQIQNSKTRTSKLCSPHINLFAPHTPIYFNFLKPLYYRFLAPPHTPVCA